MQVLNSAKDVLKFIKSLSVDKCEVYFNNSKYNIWIIMIQKYIERSLIKNEMK